MLERAHFSLNSSFIELQHILSSSATHFCFLCLSFETSFPSFGSSTLSFIEFEFVLNTNCWARVWSSMKFESFNLSSFRVLISLFKHYQVLKIHIILPEKRDFSYKTTRFETRTYKYHDDLIMHNYRTLKASNISINSAHSFIL